MNSVKNVILDYVNVRKGLKVNELVAHICSMSLFYNEFIDVDMLGGIKNMIQELIDNNQIMCVSFYVGNSTVQFLLPSDSELIVNQRELEIC